MASRSATFAAGRSGAQYSSSHSSGARISGAAPPLVELLQHPDVVVVQKPQVGDAVLEHRDPLDAHPEREPLDPLRVVAVFANVLEHVGVDHPGPEDLDPGRPFAQRAALAVFGHSVDAVEAGDVELDAGLGEGEEVGAQPYL